MSRVLGWVFVTAAVAGLIHTVQAESGSNEYGFELCNRTNLPVVYAKALNLTSKQDRAKGKQQTITSEGWFDLPAGGCAILYPGQLRYRYYMVYAEAKNSNRNWSGKVSICVQQGNFTLTGDSCAKNQNHRLFMEIDTGDSLSFTYDLK